MAQATWSSLGSPGPQDGTTITPTVTHNADGRLEVFLQTSDGTYGICGRPLHQRAGVPGPR